MNINARISNILTDRNLKQKDLCASIDVAASTLNNWLKLNRSIPSDYLIPISEFLNVSIDYLLTGEGEMHPPTEPSTPAELSETEEMLLDAYRSADKAKRRIILQKALEVSNDEIINKP